MCEKQYCGSDPQQCSNVAEELVFHEQNISAIHYFQKLRVRGEIE